MSSLNGLTLWQRRIASQGKPPPKKKRSPPAERGDQRTGYKASPTESQEGRRSSPTIELGVQPVKHKISRSVLSDPAGARYKTKERKNIQITKQIQVYIDIWNTSLFPKLKEFKSKKSTTQTKVYQTATKALRHLITGKLYTGAISSVRFPDNFEKQALKVPPERFKYLVKNLEKKSFDSDYLPRNKSFLSRTTLLCFLVGNGIYGSVPSLLLEQALIPAIPNTHMKPMDPKLSEVFRELFLQRVGKPEKALTFSDRNNLVGASNKYLSFFKQFQNSFEFYGYRDPIEFLNDYYWKAMESNWFGDRIKKIPTAYLNNSAVIDKTLVPYFLKLNMLKDHDLQGTDKEYWNP